MNTYKLARHGRRLLGEDRGVKALTRVIETLRVSRKDQVFRLDMDGIEFMDFTFGQALFVRLSQLLGADLQGYHIVLTNCTPYVEANLDILLTYHKLAVMSVYNEEWRLIGSYSQTDLDVLARLAMMKTGTASELAEQLSIGTSTCRRRLSRLVKMGLIAKRKADKSKAPAKYVYSWIIQ